MSNGEKTGRDIPSTNAARSLSVSSSAEGSHGAVARTTEIGHNREEHDIPLCIESQNRWPRMRAILRGHLHVYAHPVDGEVCLLDGVGPALPIVSIR